MATEKNAAYFMDSDVELRRLRINHAAFKDSMDKLVYAPLDLSTGSLDILDSATADGQWLRDFAAELPPTTKVTLNGADINKHYFPTTPQANEHYHVQDLNGPFPEEWHNRFDLVHQRLGLLGAGAAQAKAVAGLASLVKPGGWMQLVEVENKQEASNSATLNDWVSLLQAVFVQMGAPAHYPDNMATWMEEAGLVDVQHKTIDCLFGKLSPRAELRTAGAESMQIASDGLIGFSKTWQKWPEGVSKVDLDTLRERIGQDLTDHGWNMPIRVFWGRKPN